MNRRRKNENGIWWPEVGCQSRERDDGGNGSRESGEKVERVRDLGFYFRRNWRRKDRNNCTRGLNHANQIHTCLENTTTQTKIVELSGSG